MTARPAPHRAGVIVIVAAVVLVAYGIRLAVLLSVDGLLGSSSYDDGVYYASGAALAHGRWPYADFLLLQPPGIAIALAPLAALGGVLGDPVGVAIARLSWIGIAAASCAVLTLLAGRRSLPAALVTGAFAACFFPLAFGERSTLLEPPATLLLVVSMLLADRGGHRALLVAGVLAGLSVDLKIWYVVPVLVLAAFARYRVRFLLGAIGSAAVVAAPFLIRAPQAMVGQVLLDQLGRPAEDDTVLRRVSAMTGATWFGADGLSGRQAFVASAIVVAITLVAAAFAWRVPIGRRAVVLLLATSVVLLLSPSFFPHYVAYTGPWLALVLGAGAGEALAPVRPRALLVGGTVALTAVVASPTLAQDLRPRVPSPAVSAVSAAARRVPGCIRSDDPGLLAAMGVLSTQLERGCALRPDVTGYTFDRPGMPARAVDRAGSERWQRFVTAYLLGGDAVIVSRPGTGLSDATRRRIGDLPVLARSGRFVLHAVPR